ncbi:glucokinase [Apiospora arundinis]|uniref:Glucokinase n=1 Tax=Apiospora arundinis TaxID=335852 RepID=A0ABR2J450_9PEZI
MSPRDDGRSSPSPSLLARAEQVAREFEFSSEDARKVTAHFVTHMKNALEQQDSLSQIPSYVRAIPTGREKGVFLAVDLGGTNCRVCSVQLHGDGTYSLVQSKYLIPRPLTVNPSYKPLFRFIAEKIQDFLKEHPEVDVQQQNDEDSSTTTTTSSPRRQDFRKLGFTFSFTYEQHSLAKGSVMFWDKGWDIPEALGRDPCEMLQEGLDELRVPVLVVALANDSVGTLLTRAYTSQSQGTTKSRRATTTTIGAIFGTGTNAAYVERLANVKRLHGRADFQNNRAPGDLMVINTEWGCFGDGQDGLLPSTEYDDLLDASSPHPRQEMTEKRISGLYLGELLRLVVLRIITTDKEEKNLFNMTLNSDESPVFQPEGIESSFLSQIAADDSNDLAEARVHIAETLKASNVSVEDARAIQIIAKAIARRAARLAGVALAAIIVQCDQSRHGLSQSTASSMSVLSSKSSDAIKVEHKPITTSKPSSAIISSSSSSGNRRSAGRGFSAMCRRFRVFIYGLARSLGLGWLLKRPATTPSGGKKSGAASSLSPSSSPSPTLTTADKEAAEHDGGDWVEVGVDGSLIEFYPTFEQEMREAVGDVLGPGHEQRLRIGMAKDGSGVGAALVALAASMQQKEETPPPPSEAAAAPASVEQELKSI